MWPRRPWVQVPSLTQQISGYSVVRLTRLLWEQEIGSSNLSTPTLENAKYLSTKALLVSGAFTFNDYQSLSFIPINGTKKTGQWGAPRELGPIYPQFHWDSYGGYYNIFFNYYFGYIILSSGVVSNLKPTNRAQINHGHGG